MSTPTPYKFALGDYVTKLKGSSWTGHVVGFYSTALTPVGYAVESENEPGSVQIYPEAALRCVGEPATPLPPTEPTSDEVRKYPWLGLAQMFDDALAERAAPAPALTAKARELLRAAALMITDTGAQTLPVGDHTLRRINVAKSLVKWSETRNHPVQIVGSADRTQAEPAPATSPKRCPRCGSTSLVVDDPRSDHLHCEVCGTGVPVAAASPTMSDPTPAPTPANATLDVQRTAESPPDYAAWGKPAPALKLKLPPADVFGHRTRFSDASRYDEVCVCCGATDAAGDNRLNAKCPNPDGWSREHYIEDEIARLTREGKEYQVLMEGIVSDLRAERDRLRIERDEARAQINLAESHWNAFKEASDQVVRLRSVLADLVSWFGERPTSSGLWIIEAGTYGADDAIKAARAALPPQEPQ